jgi:hypothetical protein
MKVIEATMSDGSKWQVDAGAVAHMVADLSVVLSPFESKEADQALFASEYGLLLSNDAELLRLAPQLDWQSVLRATRQYFYFGLNTDMQEWKQRLARYEEEWYAAPKRIVEVPGV